MIGDVQTLKNLGIAAVAIYFGTLIYKIGMGLLNYANKKSLPDETEIRNKTREKIQDTNLKVNEIRNHQQKYIRDYFDTKNETHEMHEIVTLKGRGGTPAVYNPEMHDLLKDLNHNAKILSKAIDRLAARCGLAQGGK